MKSRIGTGTGLAGRGALIAIAALLSVPLTGAAANGPTAPHVAPVRPGAEASEARREALREAEAARQEAARGREEAHARAAEARRLAFAARDRALRDTPGQARAALIDARASIAAARGIDEADRQRALDGIDRALASLDRDPHREPARH